MKTTVTQSVHETELSFVYRVLLYTVKL